MENALLVAVPGFNQAYRENARDDDFAHYFTKPVDVEALLALIDKLSRARRTETPEQSRVLLVEDHKGFSNRDG